MLNGYDISDNQGNIDNTQVPGDFVIIKATEGIGYTDPDCDANYQQAKGAGKKLGVYHFARPDGNPNGADEAIWFESQVRGYVGEAVFVLDLEVNPDPAWAKTFLDKFYELTQVRPWIYMNSSTANSHDWSALWNDYALWVANYGLNIPQNGYTPSTNIGVNGNWTIVAWQYTSEGRLPGWSGALDLDVAYVDREGWDKYAVKKVVEPVTPAPAPIPPVVTPPVVEPPVINPTPLPVIPTSTPTPVFSTTPPKPAIDGLKEVLKVVIFLLPGAFIQLITHNLNTTIQYGVFILGVLKYIDSYIQSNPNIGMKGLLNF